MSFKLPNSFHHNVTGKLPGQCFFTIEGSSDVHYRDYNPGALFLSQITATHLKSPSTGVQS